MSQVPLVIDFEHVEGETQEQFEERMQKLMFAKLKERGVNTDNIERFHPVSIHGGRALDDSRDKATMSITFEASYKGQAVREAQQGWSWPVPYPSLVIFYPSR